MSTNLDEEKLQEAEHLRREASADARQEAFSTTTTNYNKTKPADDNTSLQLARDKEKGDEKMSTQRQLHPKGTTPEDLLPPDRSCIINARSNKPTNAQTPQPQGRSSLSLAPVPLSNDTSSIFLSTLEDEAFVSELLGETTVTATTYGVVPDATPIDHMAASKRNNYHHGGQQSVNSSGDAGVSGMHSIEEQPQQQQQQQFGSAPVVPAPLQVSHSSAEGNPAGGEWDIEAPSSVSTIAVDSSPLESAPSSSSPVTPPAGQGVFPSTCTTDRRSGNAEHLVVARLVSGESFDLGPLVEAKPLQVCKYVWLYALIVSLATILIIGITLGVTQRKASASNNNAGESWNAPNLSTMAPTIEPTVLPSMNEVSIVFRGRLPNHTVDALENNESSPQYQAYEWVTSDEQSPLFGYDPVKRMTHRFALATLYFATGGGDNYSFPSWTRSPGWLNYSLHECDWGGIICNSSAQGHGRTIQKIDLYDKDLKGTLPPEMGLLDGLEELHLWFNRQLMGTIPTTVALLTSLRILVLSGNQLSGPIPTELGLLTNLTILSAAGNVLNGPISTELGQLTNLVQLVVGSNALSSTIPTDIGRLTKLQRLELSVQGDGQHGLNGTIPTEVWRRLSSLQILSLHHNELTGTIAHDIGLLTNLKELYLDSNALTGTLPATMGQLKGMVHAELHNNQLNGSVPTDVCDLISMNYLDFKVDCKEVACSCKEVACSCD